MTAVLDGGSRRCRDGERSHDAMSASYPKREHKTIALGAAEAALMVRKAVNVTRPPTTL